MPILTLALKDLRLLLRDARSAVILLVMPITLLKDPSQPVTASVIEQVTQVTLLRVVIPWMIGRAFQRVGDPEFMNYVASKLKGEPIPPSVLAELDPVMQKLLDALLKDVTFQ